MIRLLSNKKVFGFLFWLWGATIFIMSSIPDRENKIDLSSGSFIRMDYLIHFGLFFILSMFFVFWKTNQELVLRRRHLISILLFGTLFALIDEWHQQFIPGRSFNFFDFLADVTGLFAGALAVYYLLIKGILTKINAPVKK